MRNITNLLLVFFVFATANFAVAQNTCCDGTTTAPEVTSGFYTTSTIGLDQNTPGLSLGVQASSDLPTVEFMITKRNQTALDETGNADTTGGGGDVIIGAVDINGVFMPQDKSRYGYSLVAGDTFDLTAVGYDLPRLKKLADSLLNGYAGPQPCCDIFGVMAVALNEPALAGFCDSVNQAGINGAADINGMEDVLVIFDAFSSGQVSVGSMIWTLQTINANGSFISTDCGGEGANNFLYYGVNKDEKYGYEAGPAVAVKKLSDVSNFVMFPNPVNAGVLNINFSTFKQVDLAVNIYSTLGQQVVSQNLGTVNGNLNTTVSTGHLSAGIYYVELTDGHNSETHKLIVK